jgi:lipoprotein-releasing system permease protein
LHFLFAWRYLVSKKNTNAINIIAKISMIAIFVGTTALILVLSVFNGFEDLVKSLYKDFYADIKITPSAGKLITIDSQLVKNLTTNNNIAYYNYVIEEKALLKNDANQTTVLVKGVSPNYNNICPINNHIVRGSFSIGNTQNPEIVVGAGIENATGIYLEQAITKPTLYLPNKQATNTTDLNNAFNSFNVLPTGTFVIQQEFDNRYIFTNVGFMQYMLNLQPNQYSYVEVKLKAANEAQIETVAKKLQQQLGNSFTVLTRYQQNQSLYTIMQMEKWVIYGILSLILVVAAFNMIGALTMLVLEKQKDIVILKAMGSPTTTIRNIFLSNGVLLAGIGCLAGMLLAAAICYLQIKYQLLKLGSNSFVVDYYPVKMKVSDFFLVAATVLVISTIAAWLPSVKAARQTISLK